VETKLTTKSQEALAAASTNASTAGNPQVEPAHILKALMDQREGVAVAVLKATGADVDAVSAQASAAIKALPSASGASTAQAQFNRGALQVIATDELCCPLRIKLQGSRIDDTTGGNSGVEPRVGLMYTQMVTKRGYTPEHFVDMVSTNAAKIMGLYPRKGALAVGSDADVVVLETGIDKTIRAEDMHETDYTPWEGHKVTAWPRVTVMRGRVVVEDGVFSGDLKQGEFLPRKIPYEVRSRPAV
jgi:dihydropyrimidinase